MAPGTARHIRSVCRGPRPQGTKDRWKSYNGRKTAGEKILEVHVDKVMKGGQKTTFQVKETKSQDWSQEPGSLLPILSGLW